MYIIKSISVTVERDTVAYHGQTWEQHEKLENPNNHKNNNNNNNYQTFRTASFRLAVKFTRSLRLIVNIKAKLASLDFCREQDWGKKEGFASFISLLMDGWVTTHQDQPSSELNQRNMQMPKENIIFDRETSFKKPFEK